ncbi:MAG: T9SS type A sorting domain-containing protein [Bacteroidales bacterium]
MKTRRLLLLIIAVLFIYGWQAPVEAQDIPTNYIQNANMEHDLNAIFWYGSWDPIYGSNGIVSHPSSFLTDDDSHSGNWSMNIVPGAYIWVSYPVRGHEEKKFKASFWYKGYFETYWNFIYRDVGMTFEDLHPSLAQYVGADTALWGGSGQDALQFNFGGDDNYTEDWTYFEFVWDFPGTIPGWGNTTMWFGAYEPAYVDDFYYGEWYDGQYSGEEELAIVNGDFEFLELNTEWLLNLAPWDAFLPSDFLSVTENHSDAGLQSLRLMDYMTGPEGDAYAEDRNVTYYLPTLGAEGQDMELSFWYKGNDAKIALEFYDDYGITQESFPLPAGASLYEDLDNPIYELDTVATFVDTVETFIDTFTVADQGSIEEIFELYIDTMTLNTATILASQNFDNPESLKLTEGAWVWSGSDNYGWDDWAAATVNDAFWSSPEALWLPGDPNWGGAEGYVDLEDNTSYILEFMYKGQLQFILDLSSTGYDPVADPDGIVPYNATAENNSITWMLNSDYWRKFRFEFTTGTWIADASMTSPANISFNIIGTYNADDLGFVDNFMAATGTVADPVVIDTMFVVIDYNYTIETTYDIDTLSTTYNDLGAIWDLPAVTDWTEWKLFWTNPAGDIGGTLTMFLDNDLSDNPDHITEAKPDFDDAHADWTYFDDFYYGFGQPDNVKSDKVQFGLKTYPNPATEMLYLSIMDPLRRIEVYNAMGQQVMVEVNPDRKLNVSGLADGIYLLNVVDEQGVVHKAKFLKR